MNLYQFQADYLAGLPEKFIFSCDTGTGKTDNRFEVIGNIYENQELLKEK